jgi:hypothetical protein
MKLDFLKEGADACPMIRLYDFRSSDVQRLIETFEALAIGSLNREDPAFALAHRRLVT